MNGEKKNTQRENAYLGYQIATTLWTTDGQAVWSKFNAMLLANSILIASIGFFINSQQYFLSIYMSIAGLVLCLLWYFIIKRGFDYYKYWIFSARELEEKYLGKPLKIVSRGALFADGKEVQLEIDKKKVAHQMSCAGQIIRVEQAASLIILLFVLIYSVLLIWSGLHCLSMFLSFLDKILCSNIF
ncbi:MAG: hypothetical protein WBB67_01600 [bacterium]